MSEAVIAAELELARAFIALDRAKGTPGEEKARARVEAAQAQLKRAEAMPVGKDEKQCCGMPMFWANGGWQCAIGHD